jgi:hypothetical protein
MRRICRSEVVDAREELTDAMFRARELSEGKLYLVRILSVGRFRGKGDDIKQLWGDGVWSFGMELFLFFKRWAKSRLPNSELETDEASVVIGPVKLAPNASQSIHWRRPPLSTSPLHIFTFVMYEIAAFWRVAHVPQIQLWLLSSKIYHSQTGNLWKLSKLKWERSIQWAYKVRWMFSTSLSWWICSLLPAPYFKLSSYSFALLSSPPNKNHIQHISSPDNSIPSPRTRT